MAFCGQSGVQGKFIGWRINTNRFHAKGTSGPGDANRNLTTVTD
jgi:hypothetical protein